MSLSNLLGRAHAALVHRFTDAATAPNLLFFSFTDGTARSHIVRAAGASFAQAWKDGATRCQAEARRLKLAARWLRVDWPVETQATTWAELAERLKRTKRNYFRMGLALDAELRHAFLEPELNANAMLYLGADKAEAGVNPKNFTVRAQRRFGKTFEPDFSPEAAVYVFTHEGLFVSDDPAINALPDGSEPNWLPATATRLGWRNPASLNAGRRQIPALSAGQVYALIESSANFLARQVKKSGQFVYGHFPCFGRLIPTYNSLRHASSVYSMLEAWELTRDDALLAAIRRGLTCLADTLIRRYPQPDGTHLAYNVDVNGEIKLGANAVSLLALVKYDELTHDTRYRGLMEELALGIARMQDANTGKLVHVLNSDDLSVKEAFRIVYYDGEAAFGLMRLYGLTRDPRWLAIVEKAFDYFIANDHWKHHDHWLSYCANELTLYKPEEKYFRFGVQNIAGYLDFILTRETTYPTLLELSMAFEAMLRRINTDHPEMRHVLDDLDIEKFHRALHHRAHYLLNGFFWPELAMYFARPDTVVGSFFIRHHSFRVRIDNVASHISALVGLHALASEGLYLDQRDDDVAAMIRHGRRLYKEKSYDEAITYFQNAIRIDPGNARAWCSMASAFRMKRAFEQAASYYAQAMALDPQHWNAMVGLSITLRKQGRHEESRHWAQRAIASKPFSVKVRSKAERPLVVHVIKALSTLEFRERKTGYAIRGGHNTADALVMDPAITRVNVYVDAFEADAAWLQTIPRPDVIFNIMADADAIDSVAWSKAEQYVAHFGVPVVNPPKAVQQTTRNGVFEAIDGIAHVVMPRTLRVVVNRPADLDHEVGTAGLRFPIIVRPTGSQTGQGLLYYDTSQDLARRKSHREAGEYYVAEFYRFQSQDGYWRKMRLFFIGGTIHPEHYVAAKDWNIHAANARALMQRKEFIDAEIDFIVRFEEYLGKQVIDAIHEIGRRMNMDYFGMDCALLPDGRLLIFEVNAAMQFKSASQNEREFLMRNRDTISGLFTRMVFCKAAATAPTRAITASSTSEESVE